MYSLILYWEPAGCRYLLAIYSRGTLCAQGACSVAGETGPQVAT